jgi:putative MFS transporter
VELIMLSLVKDPLAKLMGTEAKIRLAWLSSICFLGELVGGTFWGFVSDQLGRRATFVLTAFITAVFAVMGVLTMRSYWLFLLSRLGLGFGLGGSLAIDFIYFLEFSPRSSRTTRTVSIIFIGVSALLYVALGGILFLPSDHVTVFMVYCALPAMLLSVLRTLFPWDTPHFLYSKGRYEDCKKVLDGMARLNGSLSRLPPDSYILISEVSAPAAPPGKTLWSQVPWMTTGVLSTVFFCQTLAYYGFVIWMGKLAQQRRLQGYSHAVNLLTVALFEVVGVLLTQMSLKKLSLKATMSWNFLGAAGSLLLLALFARSSLSFLLCSSLVFVFIVGIWTSIYVQGPQLFDVPVRARLFGACSSVGKLGGILGPLVVGLALRGDASAAIAVTIACYVVGGLSILFLKSSPL